MVRLILVILVLLLTILGVLAVSLFKYFGWKGMVAFPFIVFFLVWIGKFFITKVIQRFALGLFSMKSGALKEATVTVHSITPIPRPPEPDEEHEDEEDDEGESDAEEKTEAADSDTTQNQEEESGHSEPQKPKAYYEVELTITPTAGNKSRAWEPGEFILTSEPVKKLADLEVKEVGAMHDVQVWDGAKFSPDDECKYPGEQRLKLTVALEPGTSNAWLQYYNESLASLAFPVWQLK
jgi:hypothetical protein